jgi:hypothetical protein
VAPHPDAVKRAASGQGPLSVGRQRGKVKQIVKDRLTW